MAGLLSVEEAQDRVLSVFQPVNTEAVSIMACTGRILAEDIHAPEDLPGFDNSSMDGFAVRSEDILPAGQLSPVDLDVVGDIPAGASGDLFFIKSGQAARIMTGAPLPQGADTVVPVEDTNYGPGVSNQLEDRVSIFRGAAKGANVRPRGQDVRKGQRLLNKGQRIQPQTAGMLASIGKANVLVYRRPRIGLFSSGDELVAPGRPLKPGQIYDSNQFVLAALLEKEGAEIFRLGTAPDDPQAVRRLLQKGVEAGVDLLVTSAGVSVGAFDFVRQVIEEYGKLSFWKVNMRPGKPLAFGSFQGIPLIGLPGNPVSSFVGCLVFVLPALYRLSGRDQVLPRRERAVLGEPVESDGRESYLRARIHYENGRPVARLTGHQGSGNLFSLVQANALLIVPSGVKSLPLGSEVEIWFLEAD